MPENIELPLRTPVADQMSHAEVLGLAKTWLDRCSCVPKRVLERKRYPTRLLNLAYLKKLGTIDAKKWKYRGVSGLEELENTKVNLIDSDDLDWSEPVHKEYVTLSHKWGGTDKSGRLTRRTERAYRSGVRLGDLPRTFQHAIHFALRLDDRIHYIWIDSLCIIQGDEQDWVKESDRMQDVYRNSFLNISATAAEHSGEGLYSHRDPQHLWEEVVILDVDGLHQGEENIRRKTRLKTSPSFNWGSNIIPTSGLTAVDLEHTQSAKEQSCCLLVDVSNWESLVDQAPIHKRGWVVQERLLAPRVLHFCRGRIAWECSEFDDIEGHSPSMPNYRLIGDEIYEGIPMKGLSPEEQGKKLRNIRLRGMVDPLDLRDHDPKSSVVHSLELWSRIVEMYCKTDLTKQKDKLIALSGIAHHMSTVIERSDKKRDPIRYIAGLWNVHLVGQLLWHVEPVYRGGPDYRVDAIEYLSGRPTKYRAPSFSWASVDAQFGNGIACGHVLDSDGVVEIPQDEDGTGLTSETEDWKKSISVQFETENEFGLVRSGHIRLWAWVHHVKLQRERTHYYWSLVVSNDSTTEPGMNEKRENFNIYLDCPKDDDQNNRLINSDGIYCIPMAYESSSRSNDLICLLLEKAPDDHQILKWPDEYRQQTFKRIGWTKLSASFNNFTWKYISHFKPSQSGSDEFYDGRSGRHLVCII